MYLLLNMAIFGIYVKFLGCISYKLQLMFPRKCKNDTVPKTNYSPLQNGGWEMMLSFWGPAYIQEVC